VGENYLHASEPTASLTFFPKLPKSGKYELRIAYTPGSNRSPMVPIRIYHAAGEAIVYIDQTKPGSIGGSLESVGFYDFDPVQKPHVVISPDGAASGVVVADAATFVSENDAPNDVAREETQQRIAKQQQLTSEIKALEKKIEKLQSAGPRRELAMAVTDLDEVANIPISIRGLARNPGPVVPRGFLQVAQVAGRG
jgi:hypothetical protein